MLRRVFALGLCVFFLCSLPACAMTRSQLRQAWQQLSENHSGASPYLQEPDTDTFSAGALTDEAQQNALAALNLLREIAGLEPVEISPLYTLRAQNGALLLAANDFLEHDPPRPAGMDPAQYESAHMGTSQGNIASFAWMRPEILIDGVRYFARDDGEENLSELGHRRWLLNPAMAHTGFGLASSAGGTSYVTMYAVDDGNADAAWDYVTWPSDGCFPVELMRWELAWSVSLNPSVYDVQASRPQVYIKEETSGVQFRFDPAAHRGDGFCTLSDAQLGSGACIIFRPDIAGAGLEEYLQNQSWQVEISGLKGVNGEDLTLEYRCEMVSLYPQEVANIEISHLEAQLQVGEALQLQADVIPNWADDLSIIWGSGNPEIASVDTCGLVTAVAPGECSIFAMGANGKKDVCSITVS